MSRHCTTSSDRHRVLIWCSLGWVRTDTRRPFFPWHRALSERQHLVVANWVEKLKEYRITLTLPVLNNAACVVFLVTGADKAETLRGVLEKEPGPVRFPSQLVHPTKGSLIWLVSSEAASLLPKTLKNPESEVKSAER